MLPSTLFIPLINSHDDDFALRYALRSWQMYSNINEVLIIGHKPLWYTGSHIPYHKLQSKTEDIFSKIMYAATVYDRFIYGNDDHILLQPLTDLPYYYQGLIKDFRGGSETFMRYVMNTDRICPGGYYFDVHTPMIVDSERMLSLKYTRDTIFKSVYCYGMEQIKQSGLPSSTDGTPYGTPYGTPGNELNVSDQHECTVPYLYRAAPYRDLKINHHLRTEEINKLLNGKLMFSFGDNGLSNDMRKWLAERFPDRSRWEST